MGIRADAAFPAMSGEAWDRALHTNLDGFCNVLRPLVMPLVRLHAGGRIVAISPVAGLVPMQGLGRPDEVASLVVYLFSDGAGYLTGQLISVNGGML